jgi:prepilin-type processing-associated H-X9-DG protein
MKVFTLEARRSGDARQCGRAVGNMGIATPPPIYARTDYALNGFLLVPQVPQDMLPMPFQPDPAASDLFYLYLDEKLCVTPSAPLGTKFRPVDVKDGLSNTIFVGEKALYTDQATNGDRLFQDDPIFSGGTWGTARGGTKVHRDIPIYQDPNYGKTPAAQFNQWGSPFSSGAHFLFGDGSVRLIPFGKSQGFRVNFRTLLTPQGGTASAELN